MRITTRAVWQLTDTGMVLIERDCYEYAGPVALAFGGDSDSTTSSVTETNTQNLNLQGIEGIALGSVDGSVRLEVSDEGTVEAARDIALAALDTGASGFNEAADVASDAIFAGQAQTDRAFDFALDTQGEAFGIAGDALATGERLTGDVLNFAQDAQAGVFELVRDSSSDALQFAGDQSGAFRESTENLTERFIDAGESFFSQALDVVAGSGKQVLDATAVIQARESGNTDARLESITRYALIAAGVIGGIAIWRAAG